MLYQRYYARIISDMTQVVVAVGLVTVLINYVRSGVNGAVLMSDPAFAMRCLLLLLTIMFTAYHLMAYAADSVSAEGDTGWEQGARNPLRIIFLFLLDLAALGAMAAMYGVLVLGPAANEAAFAVEWNDLAWLAALAGAWHGLVFTWHVVAGSRWTALLAHACFAGMFAGASALAAYDLGLRRTPLATNAEMAIWIGLFALIIGVLYFSRGRRILRDALAGDVRAKPKAARSQPGLSPRTHRSLKKVRPAGSLAKARR